MEKQNTKTSVNLTTATNELVFFSSIFLVRSCPTLYVTGIAFEKAVEEANSDSSRTILHKSNANFS
jgi:hypothetical protein